MGAVFQHLRSVGWTKAWITVRVVGKTCNVLQTFQGFIITVEKRLRCEINFRLIKTIHLLMLECSEWVKPHYRPFCPFICFLFIIPQSYSGHLRFGSRKRWLSNVFILQKYYLIWAKMQITWALIHDTFRIHSLLKNKKQKGTTTTKCSYGKQVWLGKEW